MILLMLVLVLTLAFSTLVFIIALFKAREQERNDASERASFHHASGDAS